MGLGDRKKQILRSIINDYIETAEPVGSRTIAKKYEMGLSSATIRNEMADLEELGYLEQPHTSSGRIPSDKGYRLYVNELMEIQRPTTEETVLIKKMLRAATINEFDKIIKRTSKILSEITKLTSAVLSPSARKSAVKSIQLIQLTNNELVAIILTDTGIVKHSMVKLPKNICSNTLLKINNIINEKLDGLTIEDIGLSVIASIQNQMGDYKEILNAIIPVLEDSLKSTDSDVYLEGTTNIFCHPEYNDIDKARSFLNVLDQKDVLFDILSEGERNLSVSIGSENKLDEVKDLSIVKASYKIGDRTVGKIGVIGPTRMDYSKVLGILKCLADALNEILTNSRDDFY